MILDEIAAAARIRVAEQKKKIPLQQLKQDALALPHEIGFPFEQALKEPGMAFICEVKKASPSKGVIAADFPYLKIAREYEQAGASAVSVLTEPKYFQGQDRYLQEIAAAVRIPVLRKDFTVDEYQIYEARLLGAAAVLLICAILDQETLSEFIKTAHRLGLSALVEAHTEAEVKQAVSAGARVIGVNNRNLQDFKVDMKTSLQLRQSVPEGVLFISESGIRTPEDIGKLAERKVDGVLIGETLMKSRDKKAAIRHLQAGCKKEL